MMSHSLADYLSVWGIESGNCILRDGSMSRVFEMTGIDPITWDDSRRESFGQAVKDALCGVPDEVTVQIQSETGSSTGDGGDRTCTVMISRLVVRVKSSSQGSRVSFFKRIARRDRQPASEVTLVRTRAALETSCQSIERAFAGFGVGLCAMPDSEVAKALYALWNPSRPIDLGAIDTSDIRQSILLSDVALSPRGFTIGSTHFRILSLKLLPDVSWPTMMAATVSLPSNSRLITTFHMLKQSSEYESLQTQRRMSHAMFYGKRTGVADLDAKAKLDDLESVLEEVVVGSEKIASLGMNVILWGDEVQELDERVRNALSTFREIGGCEMLIETTAAFDIFVSTSLPNGECRDRTKRVKTSTAAHLMPLFAPWNGHDGAPVVFQNRAGGTFSMDPFHSTLSNANQVISGGSGSGKSFLTNLLVLQMLKENPLVYFIDIGGSYRRLIDVQGGQYIPLSLDSPTPMNPFDLPRGETSPSPTKVKFLSSLVEIMTMENGSLGLGRLERSMLEETIQNCYRSGSATLSGLREALLSSSDPVMVRLGKVLGSWCGSSPYGAFFDRPTALNLNCSIVGFDLKGLESHPDLQSAMLFVITDMIWREIEAQKGRKKIVVFDECWKLLESQAGAAFIGETFRTFRKYYASAIAISQSMEDFAKSRAAEAILPNTAIKWVLRQNSSSPTSLKAILGLNETETALVQQLEQKKGHHSEAFLIAQDDRTLVSITATPRDYWIATTHPRDMQFLAEQRSAFPNLSLTDLISQIAAKHPNGAQ